jgi:hypothetical protein
VSGRIGGHSTWEAAGSKNRDNCAAPGICHRPLSRPA